MNRKKFEIWQKYKVKEEHIELQKLQEDFAGRGLAHSSIRNEAEEHLAEKYRAEIEMERETMETEESETLGRRRERRNLIWANRIIALGTIGSVILALPAFSNQINNIQVKIDSLEESIRGIYSSYVLETFCYEDLKDSFKQTELGNILEIPLKEPAIPNSVNIWEGAMSISPIYFKVNGNHLEISTNFNADALKDARATSDFKYSVTYIPE